MAATNDSGRHAQLVLHCVPLPKCAHRVPLGSSTVWSLLFSIEFSVSVQLSSQNILTRWNYDLNILLKGYCTYCIRVDHSKM
jgi:hypothetical protein